MTLLCGSVAIAGVPFTSGSASKDAHSRRRLRPCALDVLGRRVHRRHDRVLRLPRVLPGVLRRISRPCVIRTNRRFVMWIPLADSRRSVPRRRLHQHPATSWSPCSRIHEAEDRRRRHDAPSPPAFSASPSPIFSSREPPRLPESLAELLSGLYTLVYNKYFVDEVLRRHRGRAHRARLARGAVARRRRRLIDGIVNGVGTRAQRRRRPSCASSSPAISAATPRGWCFGSVVVLIAIGFAGGVR